MGKEEVKRQINEMILDKNNQFIAEETTTQSTADLKIAESLKQRPEEQEVNQNKDLGNIRQNFLIFFKNLFLNSSIYQSPKIG